MVIWDGDTVERYTMMTYVNAVWWNASMYGGMHYQTDGLELMQRSCNFIHVNLIKLWLHRGTILYCYR